MAGYEKSDWLTREPADRGRYAKQATKGDRRHSRLAVVRYRRPEDCSAFFHAQQVNVLFPWTHHAFLEEAGADFSETGFDVLKDTPGTILSGSVRSRYRPDDSEAM